MSDVVNVKQVVKKYGKQVVLNGVSLAVGKREIFGLLGPSGCGKTTLVKCIAGLEPMQGGTIDVLGVKMPSNKVLPKLGFMAQSDALYLDVKAIDNMRFFGRMYGMKGEALEKRIQEVAALVNLTDHLQKTAAQYSGGMKKRLSLAISILHEPEFLILDEPTVGIDPLLRKEIWDEFEKLAANGTTIIVTTHIMDEAERCNRLALLYNGSVIACDTPAALLAQTTSGKLEELFLTKAGGVK